MRSTGEVLGMAENYGEAFYKAQLAAGQILPLSGTVLITVHESDRAGALEAALRFTEAGFSILATDGTRKFLEANGVSASPIRKVHEGRPNITDAIKNGEIHLVVNTPVGKTGSHDDSYIRKAAIRFRLPYITTTAGAIATAKGIAAMRGVQGEVKSLQQYHAGIVG
jgi:carbamoyl-phosphate synthase large subunit